MQPCYELREAYALTVKATKNLYIYIFFITQKMDCTFKLATLCIFHFPQILGSGLYLTNNKMYVCYELFALGMMNYVFLFPLTINICIPQLSLPCMFLKLVELLMAGVAKLTVQIILKRKLARMAAEEHTLQDTGQDSKYSTFNAD